MKKIFNGFFNILKYPLWITSFISTLYIMTYMYQRLEKTVLDAFPVLIPYFILLLLFIFNIVLKQKGVNKNIFYNITCCLVLLTITFVGYRARFDTNMILNERMGYNINFNYYADFLPPLKVMLYGLSLANILLMFHLKEKREDLALDNSLKKSFQPNEDKKLYQNEKIAYKTKKTNLKKD